MHDLLNDPLIGIRAGATECRVSLSELLARLSSGHPLEYTGLRPHQADPWHVFLVQIAASVMARKPSLELLPTDSAVWAAGLLDLAEGQSTAWHLVVDDVTRPAFLQHPLVSDGELAKFKPKAHAPDELDVLVTAKNHDVKMARLGPSDPEAWLFALLTHQTCSGFLGAGNYGTVRMNGGFGSRPVVAMVGDPKPAPRFIEEVSVLRGMRGGTLSGGLSFADRGVVLTWLAPWSRTSNQWSPAQLEPWFIESVRPVRLVRHGDALRALTSTSAARQIGPSSIDNGDVGDPWVPVNTDDKKKGRSALTVSDSGWTPELLCRLMFRDRIDLTALQTPRPDMSGVSWFIGSVLVRGQGTTGGFHRFAVPVPPRARAWLAAPDERGRLARIAGDLLADAKEVEKTLRGALMVLADGGADRVDFKDATLDQWSGAAMGSHARGWADRFFSVLWQVTDVDPAIVRNRWRGELVQRARDSLEDARRRLPTPSSRRYRAQVRAIGYLEGTLRKKGLVQPSHEQQRQEEHA